MTEYIPHKKDTSTPEQNSPPDDFDIDFPETIKVSGMPLMYMGWNGIYRKTIINDKVCYYLGSYVFLYFFSIAPATISKVNDRWVLINDDYNYCTHFEKTGNQDYPFNTHDGDKWTGNIKVEPVINQ